METLEKKPQETLNHKKPKSHISFSSLPGQPLTAPVKKNSERTGAAGRLLFPAHKGRPPPPPASLSNPISNHLLQAAAPLENKTREQKERRPSLSSRLPPFSAPLSSAASSSSASQQQRAKSTAPSSLRLSSSVSLTGQQQSSFLHQQTQLTASNSLHRLLRRRLQLLPQAQRQPLLSSSPSTDLSSGSFCPRDRPNSPCS